MDERQGWVKLHRKTVRSAVFEQDTGALLKLWCYLLIEANWEPRQLSDGTTLEAGQLVMGYRRIGVDLKWGVSKVQRWIRRLEVLGNITTKRRCGTLAQIITICNWDTYQGDAMESGTQPGTQTGTQPGTQTGTQPGTQTGTKRRREEVKKERSKEKDLCQLALTLPALIDDWNAIKGVQQVKRTSDKRQTAFRARAGSNGWCEDVPAALAKVAASSFCRGHNDRNWRATIDWFLRPDTVTKLLEGTYDDREPVQGTLDLDSIMERLPDD